MDKIINAIPVNHDLYNEDIHLELPNRCPVCSIAYSELPLQTYYVEYVSFRNEDCVTAFSTYFCPHCNNFFAVQYLIIPSTYSRDLYGDGRIMYIYPSPSSSTEFSGNIQKLSPKFVEIYNQAEKAENLNLNEICGMGYRKALEFLVKDYSIHIHPDKTDEIKKLALAECIKKFIDNKKITSLSTASAWIGNDETHYTRKHDDYNLQHLKIFINAAVSYIDSELVYLEAEHLLSSPKK